MSVVVDLEHPPRRRLRDALWAALIGLPVTAALLGAVVPGVLGGMRAGARDLDERLAQRSGYIRAVCSDAFTPERDDALCGCASAFEFPALDCVDAFRAWVLEVQALRCRSRADRQTALSYCSCIFAVDQLIREEVDAAGARKAQSGIDRCEQLPDAMELPSTAELQASTAELQASTAELQASEARVR